MRDKSRRTRHIEDDDHDDTRSFLNLSDDEDDSRRRPAGRADPVRASISSACSSFSTIPTKRYGANTGPKGVISDAQDFRDSRRNQRTSMRASCPAATLGNPSRGSEVVIGRVDEEDDFGLDAEEDDGFMKKWMQSRLKEMQGGLKESTMHRNGTKVRAFGSLTMVDPDGYLDAVDNSPPDTVVVVYIYDDYVSHFPSLSETQTMAECAGWMPGFWTDIVWRISHKSVTYSRGAPGRLQASTKMHASSNCTMRMRRWSLWGYPPSSPTATAINLQPWCR